MAADRPEPLIFSAWLRAFSRTIGEERLGGLFAAYWGYRPLFSSVCCATGRCGATGR